MFVELIHVSDCALCLDTPERKGLWPGSASKAQDSDSLNNTVSNDAEVIFYTIFATHLEPSARSWHLFNSKIE